nr:hypothetical protein [uncultured Dyadobacter sp.]
MKKSYEFIDFSHATLYPYFYSHKPSSYSRYSTTFFEQQFDKISYLYSYLDLLGAKYVLVEEGYLSKDFSRDYTLYYNSSFTQWQRSCKRLHFFRSKVDKSTFKKSFERHLLSPGTEFGQSFWNDDYLGFIVIKPIPVSSIGYTLLRHYNYSLTHPLYNPNRVYFAARSYKIHLFGHEIEISTLAFQEQDSMVAACATMSVWFLQQKALTTNLVVRKSPGEITKDAGELLDKGERVFPNSGLKVPELCRAIQKNGLDPHVRNERDKKEQDFPTYLKRVVNAYYGMKLPIVLINKLISSEFVNLEKNPEEDLSIPTDKDGLSSDGDGFANDEEDNDNGTRHAVAICGFRSYKKSEVKLEDIKSRKSIFFADYIIEKLFVHDDQFGPFASLDISEKEEKYEVFYQHGTIKEGITYAQYKKYKPDNLIIPLLPKVKITYDQIEPIVSTLNSLFGLFFGVSYSSGNDIWSTVLWDIRLVFGDDYKHNIREEKYLRKTDKYNALTQNLPKLVWVARALFCDEDSSGGTQDPIIDLVFDAGGLVNSLLCVSELFYLSEFERDFRIWINDKLNDRDFLARFEPIDVYLKYLSEKRN